jgi:hypothetical protein
MFNAIHAVPQSRVPAQRDSYPSSPPQFFEVFLHLVQEDGEQHRVAQGPARSELFVNLKAQRVGQRSVGLLLRLAGLALDFIQVSIVNPDPVTHLILSSDAFRRADSSAI